MNCARLVDQKLISQEKIILAVKEYNTLRDNI